MKSQVFVRSRPRAALCPYFQSARADSSYRVGGICKGLPGSLPMFPTMEEYRTWCTSANHPLCPVYRSRHGEEKAEVEMWLRIQYETWGVSALGAAA